MDIKLPSAQRLASSVIAVPPLARNNQGQFAKDQNLAIIRHIESGGVSHLLYGGNALFYHLRFSEYASVLQMLNELAAPTTSVCPSIGPTYGLMLDHVDVLKDLDYPTAMVLPQRDITDPVGIASGIRSAAERLGRPLVLYLKFNRWLPVELVKRLEADGAISWIKYAVVLENPSDDPYLSELLDFFPAERMISGIGEQPAIVHLHEFGLGGFTSGCVCVHPANSQRMLNAIKAGRLDEAESIRQFYVPLEDLRNEISPIRVLHEAVELAGVAKTGPLLPLVSPLEESHRARIRGALDVMKNSAASASLATTAK